MKLQYGLHMVAHPSDSGIRFVFHLTKKPEELGPHEAFHEVRVSKGILSRFRDDELGDAEAKRVGTHFSVDFFNPLQCVGPYPGTGVLARHLVAQYLKERYPNHTISHEMGDADTGKAHLRELNVEPNKSYPVQEFAARIERLYTRLKERYRENAFEIDDDAERYRSGAQEL